MKNHLLALWIAAITSTIAVRSRADILREYWLNIPGTAVSDLTSSTNFPSHPDGTSLLPSFEAPTDWADNYGTRVRGYVIPATTGAYTFWIASDDNSELWLSPGDDPEQRALIASVQAWTPPRNWSVFPSQKSAPVALVAGSKYYIEALQKEGGGGDNLAVGWSKPGEDSSAPSEVIPGTVLLPWTGLDTNYNSAPVVSGVQDTLLPTAPASLHLKGIVEDDGKPLPGNPANPSPNDPNKLRWAWSEVSSPPDSQGVIWTGNPRSGEAFTYAGSPNPPGTVFTADPTAHFDVPGDYYLQFSATDGAKTTTRRMHVAIKSTTAYRSLGYAYLSPTPRAEYTSPQTRYILLRFQNVAPTNIANFSSFVQVVGAQSGPHAGQTALASDGRTVRYVMTTDFAGGEVVTVSLAPQLKPGAHGTLRNYQYTFVVSGHFPDPGIITARGDLPPANGKSRAFDGNLNTQWADAVVPDGNGVTSWIQYLYPGNGAHVVNAYALASAVNSPEADPSDWNFYGVNPDGSLVLLDRQIGQVFTGRSQWITNAIANVVDFAGYRLEITRVRDPVNAVAVQLAELQLINPSGSVLREYWTDVAGVSVSDLTGDPRYPLKPSGSDLLPTFEAPIDWGVNNGERVRGFLTAPRTGLYTFWISSDDGGELWLSTDETPANRTLIASVPGWTGSREWGKYTNQMSSPIPLAAGTRYFIEAIQKQGGGGDNLAVGWARPGQPQTAPSEVIPGEVLSPWTPSPGNPIRMANAVYRRNPSPRAQRAVAPASGASATAWSSPRPGPGHSAQLTTNAPTFPNGVSVPADFPRIQISVNDHPDPDYIFLDNRGGGGHPYNVIFDNSGSPVWYMRMPDERRDMKVQHNGVLTMLARDNGNHFNGFDHHYNLIKTYWADNGYGVDEHELQLLANGNYLLVALRGETIDMTRYIPNGNPNAGVTEQAIQEFTPAGELIFQWRALDNFDIRDQGQFIDITGSGFDFPHMNAIDIDTDGNILLSSRSLSEVTKIDRTTGEFIWRLGGNHNQMTFPNDPLAGPRNQHAIRSVGTNHYTLFDNGDLHSPSVSRGVEYQVDPVALTATVVWQYPKTPTPDYYSFYMGDVQRLTNGNTLINWAVGNLPKLTEVRPDGTKAYEMNWVDGFEAYRVWRCPWDGVALQPYLIVEPNPDNVTLTFNQFGDKNVAYYKIYGGLAPQPTQLLATSRVTRKPLVNLKNGQTYYFRVTAVNNQGVEGPFSNEESVTVNIVPPGRNSVQNGDFSQGQTDWNLSLNGGASSGSFLASGGVGHVAVANPGTTFANIQLQNQAPVALVQGGRYLFEFDAWASKVRIIQSKIAGINAPFTDYSRIGYSSLGVTKKHFRYLFTMLQPTDLAAQIEFNVGGSAADVFIQNVSLINLAPGDLNFDGHVDWLDLKTFSGSWLKSDPTSDLNQDGRVDFRDFDILGQSWNGK